MFTHQDLQNIYGLIERTSVSGKEVEEVVRLKLKIIEIIKVGAKNNSKEEEDSVKYE